jgi:hypothetical protein
MRPYLKNPTQKKAGRVALSTAKKKKEEEERTVLHFKIGHRGISSVKFPFIKLTF